MLSAPRGRQRGGTSIAGTRLIGLKESFWGFLACGLLVLLCYLVFKVGGGDVKLMP